ncbi:MAG: response regulator [Opitutales bacterium]
MARILIVDDDTNFNALLCDIFEQSGYDVTAVSDPAEGFQLYRDETFSLVVTDQKMPGMTGEALIRKMRSEREDTPIIMVSGYLDNETIRSLIREGVAGVFLKPLNVFSLLKRAGQLIEANKLRENREETAASGGIESEDFEHGLPFSFSTFPCKATASLEFAKRLYELRNFKSNLLIVGGKGTDLASITRDLTGFETDDRDHFCQLNPSELEKATVSQAITDARQRHATRLTLIVAHPNALGQAQRDLVYAASRHEAPFEGVDFPVRFVFFLTDEIDALYDRGELSDDLYMFLGTLEVRVPDLQDIRDDLPILMLRYLREEAAQRRMEPPKGFDARARIFLREREWAGNSLEMRSFCRELVPMEKEVISREDLETVQRQLNLGASSFGALNLKSELWHLRDDYCRAMLKLCDDNAQVAARLLRVDADFLTSITSSNE